VLVRVHAAGIGPVLPAVDRLAQADIGDEDAVLVAGIDPDPAEPPLVFAFIVGVPGGLERVASVVGDEEPPCRNCRRSVLWVHAALCRYGPRQAGRTLPDDRAARATPLSSGECRDAPLAGLDRCSFAAVGTRQPPAGPTASAWAVLGSGRRNADEDSCGITSGTLGSIPVQMR
jgi:hypothetical protein